MISSFSFLFFFLETDAVLIKKESNSTEMPVDVHHEVEKDEPLEQTIAVKTEVEPMDEELRSPNHLEQVTHFLLISFILFYFKVKAQITGTFEPNFKNQELFYANWYRFLKSF